jgi:hypothetical protein
MAARVAAYDDAMAKGLGEAEALRRSQDVLNFTMRGDHAAMKFLASTVPFLNARMQGLYRTGRGLRENPASVLLRGGLIAAASIALWSINKDDPEYQQKEDWDKNYAWQFKIGPGEWFRLPKPFEFGAFFATLPEMIMDYMDNGDQKQFADALSANILNQLKFNPVPALVQPIIDLYANKDHFTGRPIVSPAEQGVSAPNQYGPNTSPTMIGLGQTLGISPDQAEYLVHGYGAALGGYLLAASDMVGQALGISGERADRRLSQYPVISRFLHEDPTSENRWKTALYDMEREINQMRGDVQKMRNGPEAAAYARENAAKLALYPAVKSLTANLATLRHAMVQVSQDPNLSGADKRIKLDELTAAQNRVAAQVRPLLRRYEGLPIQ